MNFILQIQQRKVPEAFGLERFWKLLSCPVLSLRTMQGVEKPHLLLRTSFYQWSFI